MAFMSAQQIRALFESVITQYESLTENRTQLETDCTKLREYIDGQVQQIQSLNTEFEKLRQDYSRKRADLAARLPPEPAPPPAEPPQEDAVDQPWEVVSLIPLEEIAQPLIISLAADIMDVSVISSTAFSPDGSSLAIGSNRTLRIYSIEKDQFTLQETLPELPNSDSNHVRCVAWAKDGTTVLCGSEDGTLRTYSVSEERALQSITISKAALFQIAVSSNADFFAVTSGDGSLILLRLSDYEVTFEGKRETEEPAIATSVSISSDDALIAVGYADLHVGLWDVASHSLVAEQICHTSGVYAVQFVPNKEVLITAALDAAVKIWNIVRDGDKPVLELSKTLEGHSNYVLCLAIDPTGELLLSGSKDLTAAVSSVSTGKMLYSVKGHTNSVITVAYSPRGNVFCTGSGDQSVRLWSILPEDTA
jgi:WD40 repeat protein